MTLDNYSPHVTAKDVPEELGTDLVFILEGCTCIAQPMGVS